MTAAQIYQEITGGEGTGKLSAAQEAAVRLRRRLEERADEVMSLGSLVQEGWQGEAGAAAANAAAPLARAAMQDAEHLSAADSGAHDQIGAFDRARSRVVPVPPQPPELTAQDIVEGLSTGDFGAHQRRLAEYNTNSQTNIAAFSAYHQASMATGQTYPTAYTPMADPGGSIGLADGGTGGTDSEINGPQRSSGPVIGGSAPLPPGTPPSGERDAGTVQSPPPEPGGAQPQPVQSTATRHETCTPSWTSPTTASGNSTPPTDRATAPASKPEHHCPTSTSTPAGSDWS
ncbi:PPE domain-containing protein [Amycolatopsis cihanbeyliensis]|uniref:PPE domain-containing protein n=1 Tax=Amycolatopsis cihanbeyliensis TaxID=1128664 RepID=UPI00147762A6|nr:PPE domain-containing protein [Amycolatopsis cihanbeyliensis]